ncbi:MFS transporter [Pseudonocardia phyllosphaerae]|uniref:MFS transporter n=1 Tax=Pseudonocardia phyllosphaerae TaxID=3390502 RepID=UPI0039789B66
MSRGTASEGPGLRREPGFVLLWIAQTASIAGGQVRLVVLPVLAYQTTGSASLTALLVTVQAAPYLLFGLVAGAVSDRANRRAVMVTGDLVSAVSMASIPFATTFGPLSTAHLFLAAAATGTAFVWHDSALFGALPAIVGRDRLVGAYSVLVTTSQVLQIAATALAGVLIAVIGPDRALWIDGACYTVSALAILAVPGRLSSTGTRSGPRPSLLTDVREGLRYVWDHPVVWPLTAAGFGSAVSSGAVIGLVVVYGIRRLGLADDSPFIGWLFTALAAGGLLAGVCLPILSKRFSPPRVSLLGLAAMSVLLVLVAVNSSFPVGLVLLVVWGMSSTLVITNGIALRQQLTPDRLQGRVNVTARMIAYGGSPLGAALGGLLADHTSVRVTFLVMTVAVAASFAYAWRSPLRRLSAADVANMAEKAG